MGPTQRITCMLYSSNCLKHTFRHFRGKVSGRKQMSSPYFWPIESTKIKKISPNFAQMDSKTQKRQNELFWKFEFLANIWKKIICNQNFVISCVPRDVSYCENFRIRSRRKLKNTLTSSKNLTLIQKFNKIQSAQTHLESYTLEYHP